MVAMVAELAENEKTLSMSYGPVRCSCSLPRDD